MSSPTPKRTPILDTEDNLPEPKSPNLFLLYGLLALAILGAMAVAALIVLPFYKRL